LVVLFGALVPRQVGAHEFRAGVLSLDEQSAGVFAVQWRAPFDGKRRELMQVRPAFPEHCKLDGSQLDCGDAGLEGAIVLSGLEQRRVDVVVRVKFRTGATQTHVLHGQDNMAEIERGPSTVGETGATVIAYVVLGVEHILMGWDHLLFVLGLVVLVTFRRSLVWTVTGFTVAHSLTLASSVVGLYALPQAPVEAVIALSILLLAVEISRNQDSLTRRAPAAVAFGFGLVHGFGFSGALREIGLAPDQIPASLLGFNLGVELGQLAVIAACYIVWRVAPIAKRARTLRVVAAYAMGSIAAFWAIERIVGFWRA
jgi:hydrogenase/urease accessory protein HupE